MARVEFLPEVYGDFDRFLDHMARFEDVATSERNMVVVWVAAYLTDIGRRTAKNRPSPLQTDAPQV